MGKWDEFDPLYDEERIMKKEKKVIPTTKYKFCNHHHEITKEQKIVDFGSGKFVADKIAIPLLKALNEIGLETRTHHIDENCGFVGIMIDNVDIKISKISRERDADRTKYNNKYELLISWDRKSKKRNKGGKIKSKICSKCRKSKPLNEFYKNPYNKDGLAYSCKVCRRKRYLEKKGVKKWLKKRKQ